MIVCTMPGCQTTVGCVCNRRRFFAPPAYNHCTCDCHRGTGKMHIVPCCSPPPTVIDEDKSFWIEVRQRGLVPMRKGPFPIRGMAKTLREFIDALPGAYLTVVTLYDGQPLFEDATVELQICDGRSDAVARRHRSITDQVMWPPSAMLPMDFNGGIEAAAAYHDREAARYAAMGKRWVKRQATHEICAAQIRCIKQETRNDR